MNDKDYAVMNLRTTAENVLAYASFAIGNLSVDDYEIHDRAEKAAKAIRTLANWIEKH